MSKSNVNTTPRVKYLGANLIETQDLVVTNKLTLNNQMVSADVILNAVPSPSPKLPTEDGVVLTGNVDGTTQWTKPIDLVDYDQTFHGSKTFAPASGVGMLFSLSPTPTSPDSLYFRFHIQGFDGGTTPFMVRTDQYAINTGGTWTLQSIGAGFIYPGTSSPVAFTTVGTQIVCTLALNPAAQRQVTWHMTVDSYSNQHVTYTPL